MFGIINSNVQHYLSNLSKVNKNREIYVYGLCNLKPKTHWNLHERMENNCNSHNLVQTQ